MSLPQNSIKVLGAYGSKYNNFNSTTIQLTNKVLIDAGNVMKPLGNDARYIEHIFLTHAHFDHIVDLPFLIETFFELRTKTLNIYATKETIDILKKDIFNNNIWPDFTKINLLNKLQSLKLNVISIGEEIEVDGITIKAVENNHCLGSCGYVFKKNSVSFLFSGDTYLSNSLIDEINSNSNIKGLIIETSFPSKYDCLAHISKHLTPKLLKVFLDGLERKVKIYINHIKPLYRKQILDELKIYKIDAKVLEDGDTIFLEESL